MGIPRQRARAGFNSPNQVFLEDGTRYPGPNTARAANTARLVRGHDPSVQEYTRAILKSAAPPRAAVSGARSGSTPAVWRARNFPTARRGNWTLSQQLRGQLPQPHLSARRCGLRRRPAQRNAGQFQGAEPLYAPTPTGWNGTKKSTSSISTGPNRPDELAKGRLCRRRSTSSSRGIAQRILRTARAFRFHRRLRPHLPDA